MASEIGYKLNRVYRTSIAAAQIGNEFLAVQVYSNPGNPIYIDGIHVGLIAATSADAALVTFKTARILRDAIFQIGVNFNTTLLSRTFEEYWAH